MNTVETSEKVDELFGALAKAQGKFKPIKKGHKNPFYHSKYADLSDVIEATRDAMSKNELCTLHGATVDSEARMVTISTRLGHSSGQWVQQEITLPGTMKGGDDKDGNKTLRFDAQSVGSAITYGRRYGLSAILGVASEEDDDGNGASGKSGESGGDKSTNNKGRKPPDVHGETSPERKILEVELTQWANGDLLSPDESTILHKKLGSNFNDEAMKALHRETRKKVIERQKVVDAEPPVDVRREAKSLMDDLPNDDD